VSAKAYSGIQLGLPPVAGQGARFPSHGAVFAPEINGDTSRIRNWIEKLEIS
jgi:hypothetical protein